MCDLILSDTWYYQIFILAILQVCCGMLLWFNLHFSIANDVEHNMFIYYPYIFIGEVFIQVFCPFSNWIVCFLTVEFREFFSYFV